MKRLIKKAMESQTKQMTKSDFIDNVNRDGYITLDADGKSFYVVTQVNTTNFSDLSDKLVAQLKEEGKYDSWCGFCTSNSQAPFSCQYLPIYGDAKKYVTKWFRNSANEAIERDLSDRNMALLERANSFVVKK